MGEKKDKSKKAGLLGVGLDATDGEVRLTRGKNFAIVGGSEETHSVMQETALRLNEKLGRKGKELDDVEPHELRDMLTETIEHIGVRRIERN